MLPLDTVANDGSLKDPQGLGAMLDKVKSANVDGFMADCWWGVTEKTEKAYDFAAYKQLVSMAKGRGMKVQFVASFHECGGNVGDSCNIPVPSFVGQHNDVFYKDQFGNTDKEYISLFADNVTVGGRTPLQMYSDWFEAFATTFAADLGSTIAEIQVGMGPAGELRYPSYQLQHWSFCGIGAFQCFDEYALKSFKAASAAAGHPEWISPPTDAGNYNSRAEQTSFFQGGYTSPYGKFFLDWYSGELKRHGAAVLSIARARLGQKVRIAGKISGIHWWYKSSHHAAELTAGYYNANQRNGYAELAEVFHASGAMIDFTCLEMRDSEQSSDCASGPQELVAQVFAAGRSKGVVTNGENALPRYDDTAYQQISSYRNDLQSFTYLRLGGDLLKDDNLGKFKNFVAQMRSGSNALVDQVVV